MSWLNGWNRRKSKIVNGTTVGAQTNYQLQLTIYKSSGTDTSTNVYLGTNVRNDFGDIRFTSSDGLTPLSYWIESYTSGTSAIVWIKIDSIPASPSTTTIYIYYDKSSATTTSDGLTTFDFFEDFETYTLNQTIIGQNGWFNNYGTNNQNMLVTNDYATHGSQSLRGISSVTSRQDAEKLMNINYDATVEFSIRTTKATSTTYDWVNYNFYAAPSGTICSIMFDRQYDGYGAYISAYPSPRAMQTYNTNQWYNIRLDIKISTQKFDIWIDGIKKASDSSFYSAGVTALNKIGFDIYHYSTGSIYGWFDNVRIRKYTSPEPTCACSGMEELSTVSWLTGWNRRKLKTINGSIVGVQTNYQIKLIVHKGSGIDTTTDIYLGTNVKDDFNDLRFTSNDGSTLLNYWIESITGTTPNFVATVWIQIPSIPANPCVATIYVYYGNSGATSSSNGSNTFMFFEDFESYTAGQTIIGQNNWTSAYATSHAIASNDYSVGPGTKSLKLTASGNPEWATANKLLPAKLTDDIIVEYDFMTDKPTGNTYSYSFSQMYDVTKDSSGMGVGRAYDGMGAYFTYHSTENALTTYSLNTWYKFRMDLLYSTKKVSHYINGTRYTTDVNFYDITATGLTNIYFHQYVASATYSTWIDNIRIRKYVSTEPTWFATGTEETLTCGTPSANLVVLEIVSNQLLRQYPSYIDIDTISKLLDNYR